MELQLAKPVKLCKTFVLPVDDRITKTKVKFLDKLTARITYGVQLFLEKIISQNITSVKEAEKYRQHIQAITGLSSAFAITKKLRYIRDYHKFNGKRLQYDTNRDISGDISQCW